MPNNCNIFFILKLWDNFDICKNIFNMFYIMIA